MDTVPQSSKETGQEPKAIKIFGTLHLIFGSLGVIFALCGLLFTLFIGKILGFLEQSVREESGEEAEEVALLLSKLGEFMEQIRGYSLVSHLVLLVLLFLMLRAGLALIKRKKGADRLSIQWSWLAIGYTILSVVIGFFTMVPLTSELQDLVYEVEGVSPPPTTAGAERILSIVSALFQCISLLIYPVLALVFLKRPEVRRHLEKN
ncbi:MAG: hypothetical protein Q7Q71_11645 [Verrucomicrobiota bacterium JB023]|nr:hypothetical protein [Verrucomicrobiota bacterium JB023]